MISRWYVLGRGVSEPVALEVYLERLPGKPVAYNLWATFSQLWATLGYSGLLFWATWRNSELLSMSCRRFKGIVILDYLAVQVGCNSGSLSVDVGYDQLVMGYYQLVLGYFQLIMGRYQ